MREEDAAVVVVAAFCRLLLLFQTESHLFIYSFPFLYQCSSGRELAKLNRTVALAAKTQCITLPC